MKRISKPYKILIAIILMVVIASVIKPNIAKSLYKKIMDSYAQEDDKLKQSIKSLRVKIKNDSTRYEFELRSIDNQYKEEIKLANDRFNWLNKKYKRNAEELDNYRNSSFDGKFELFSNAVIGEDTVQR